MRARKFRNRKGQAIVEYSAVIAFVCVMIAMAFRIANGTLFTGITGAYSNCNNSLAQMNQAAMDAGR